MSGRQISDSEPEVVYDLGNTISLIGEENNSIPIEKVRNAVNVTKEAVHAISITALETLRESALFMGVIGSRGELVNPFSHIDAALWSENRLPEDIIQSAYDYCEELTRRKQEIFIIHSNTFQNRKEGRLWPIMHSAEELTT